MKKFNLRKLSLIAKREISVRLQNKLFLLSMVLIPLLFVGVYLFPVLMMIFTSEEKVTIEIYDPEGKVSKGLQRETDLQFTTIASQEEFLKKKKQLPKRTVLLKIPEELSRKQINVLLYTHKALGLKAEEKLRKALRKALTYVRLQEKHIDIKVYKELDFDLDLQQIKIGKKEEKIHSDLGKAIGFVSALLMYFLLTGYGGMLSNSIISEKRNKIVEMLFATAKPMELLFGKITGIALLSFIQYFVWGILFFIFSIGASFILPKNLLMRSASSAEAQEMPDMSAVLSEVSVDTSFLIIFVFLFLLGFLMYASMFAAVASIGDPDIDAGKYTIIVMIPMIIAISSIGSIAANPDTGFALFLSYFPLTAPMIFPMRLAMGSVETQGILLVFLLLFLATFLFVYLGAKIYKANLLTTKFSLRELFR